MKKFLCIGLSLVLAVSLAACGKSEPKAEETSVSSIPFVISEEPIEAPVESAPAEEAVKVEEVIPENSYRSELTNEWISNDIKNQRPIAVMVDNESTALPHYGTSDADIVYEMVNSTLNGRITRFMCLIKDWQNIEMIGNVRSTRPTNCFLFSEYNAILIHDGGPFMINDYLSYPNATNHLSGGFARIDRGKDGFYEEYATAEDYKGTGEYAGKSYDGILTRITKAGYDVEYNNYYMGEHFNFSDEEFTLDDASDSFVAEKVELPFPHNSSTLTYDAAKGKYVYSEYGKEYHDAVYSDGRGLEFENVIIYGASIHEYGDGYMLFNAIGSSREGYYCTNGKAIPVEWSKANQDGITNFYKLGTKDPITLNTGKTYIALVPSDAWDDLVIK